MMVDRALLHLTKVLVGLLALTACAETGEAYYKDIESKDYPKPDSALGEALAAGEIESAARIAATIEAHLRYRYPDGQIFRDAHPKADGCVTATLTVDPGLGPPLNRGIFAQARSYDAIIRFSNANEDRTRSDTNADGRGMAIKVFGIPEQPITQDPDGPPSQDFIMISHPTFLVADPGDYRRLIGFVDSADPLTRLLQPVLSLFSIGWTGVRNAVQTTSLKIDNPLNTRYWSMVPYQLGQGPAAVATKFSAGPCQKRPVVLPSTTDPDYLRHAMAATLAPGGAGACMAFAIQPRTSAAMSVEDPRHEWPEAEAPFNKVATIKIPPQIFDTAEKNRACEQLSFSPWHAVPDQKPLGAVNRMRKVIYERISAIRRASAASAEVKQ